MASYLVQHRDHNDNILHTYVPEELSWSKNLNDPHTFTCQMSLDNPIIQEENTPEGDFAGAYQTDFRLIRDGNIRMAGMITSLHIPQGQEYIQIEGKDWSHYLSRRIYPFNPLIPTQFRLVMPNPGTSDPDPDVTDIIYQMLNTVQQRDYSLILDLSDLVSRTTFTERIRIEFGDTEDILSKIKTFAEGKPGFDFEVTWDRKFKLYYPEYSDPTILAWSLGGAFSTPNSSPSFLDMDWTDNGPTGTHLLALGAGSSFKLGRAIGSVEAQQQFRRLDHTEDFGDVPNRAKLNRLANGALSAAIRPQREVPMKVVPEDIPDFFDKFHPGVYFYVSWDLEAHQVTGEHKLLGFEVNVDNAGNEEVTLHESLWRAWYTVDDIVVQV